MVGARGVEPIGEPERHLAPDPAQGASTPDTCASTTSDGGPPASVKARQGVGQAASAKQSKGSQTEDHDFAKLAEVWPLLSAGDRAALLALAASLGAKASV
jgi:hypothetical protein